jgi:hypothetical protein
MAVKNVDCGYFQPCENGFLLEPEVLAMQQAAPLGYLLISKGCISFSKI